MPQSLDDLKDHDCLVLKERNNAFGVWELMFCSGRSMLIAAVRGPRIADHPRDLLQPGLGQLNRQYPVTLVPNQECAVFLSQVSNRVAPRIG